MSRVFTGLVTAWAPQLRQAENARQVYDEL